MPDSAANRAVSVQVLVALGAAALFYLMQGSQAAQAALFGAAIAVVNKLLLVWRFRQGARRPPRDAQKQLREFYRASFERFVIVSLLLAAGMGSLGLMPLPVLVGFVSGQMALIVSQFTRGIE